MKTIKKIIILIVLLISVSLIPDSEKHTHKVVHNKVKRIYTSVMPSTVIKADYITPMVIIQPKSRVDFLDKIGFNESGNNYKVVNTYGYLGKYQFGKTTLKTLGYKGTTSQFLNSPKIQEQAMHKLLLLNKRSLKKYIEKYEGKTVHGIYITESGILAAAHLAGAGKVRRFFRKGKDFKDGYGTRLTTYLKLYSGYKLDLTEKFTKFS